MRVDTHYFHKYPGLFRIFRAIIVDIEVEISEKLSAAMEKELAQFKLSDNDDMTFLVEVDRPPVTSGRDSGVQRVAVPGTNQRVIEGSQSLEAALKHVQPVISKVVSRMKSGLTTPADAVEVTFGLKLAAETGVVFGSVGGEVTFEVTLKWNKD